MFPTWICFQCYSFVVVLLKNCEKITAIVIGVGNNGMGNIIINIRKYEEVQDWQIEK